ncbi:hypothetical protein LQW54_005380 [Pestalotiopsis sp. IQ-011]
MVSLSQASTASADVSDDDAKILDEPVPHQGAEGTPSKKNKTQQDKHHKLGATVKWTTKDQQRTHPDLTFDLQYHATQHTAFFKLRASVEMKRGSLPEQVPIFVFLAPEVIQAVSLDCEHAQELGPDTVGLRFELRSGKFASIIVPKDLDVSRILWKNKRSSDTWDSLRCLLHASHFDVLCRLPRRTMPEARLRSMCDALSGSNVSSTPGYADLAGLYRNTGGKVVQLETEAIEVLSNESPPAYQDLEPGPPMPPVLPEKASNKRRRGNSDVEPSTSCGEPGNDMEAMKAWLLTTLEASETRHKAREAGVLRKLEESEARHKAREDALFTELEESKVREAALRMEVDKLKEHQGSVDGKVQELEAKIDELDDELEVRIECKVDDLDQTLPSRIQGVLEGAIFSARF